MNEIEREDQDNQMMRIDIEHAIKHLEQQIDELLKRNYITPAYEIHWRYVAIELCRAELSRFDTAPLTCAGCKQQGAWDDELEYGYNCPCFNCKRNCVDRYEPKGVFDKW